MNHPKKRLDAVAEILMGQAPPGESYNLEGDGWPLLAGAGDFKGEHPVAKKFTTEALRIGIPGDIVIGVRASIGDKVIADQAYCLGRDVAALRARSELHDRYLWHWLSSIKPSLEAKGKGATFKQVTKEDIAELEIPLPPLEEQRSIAAILDKAASLAAAQQRRTELLWRIEASLFGQTSEKTACDSKKCTLQDLTADGDKINYGVVQPGNQVDDGIPLIRVGDLMSGGVDREVGPADIGSKIARAVARIPVSETVNRKWLAACLRSSHIQRYFTNELRTVSQPTLNIKQIKETEINLPPIELQNTFASKLHAVERVCKRSSFSEAQTRQMISAIQSRAFSGLLQLQ